MFRLQVRVLAHITLLNILLCFTEWHFS